MTFTVNHIATGLILILIVGQGVLARFEYGSFYPALDIPQYILDETETMDDDMYSDVKKYPQSVPTYLASWPWLRDILPPTSNVISDDPSVEDKMPVPEVLPTPLSLQKVAPFRKSSRSHDKKRNTSSRRRQYMSPCHFKICNMGKRNAPSSRK